MTRSFQKLMGLTVLAIFAFSCQNLQEEVPVINQLTDGNLTTASSDSDPNARKGQLGEFGAFLIGTEENPSVSSPGSGAARITQINGNTLKFELRVANTTGIIFGHLHNASSGTNGGVVVTLIPNQSPSPLSNGMIAEGIIDASKLTGPLAGKTIADLVEEMKAGRIYANVHTSTNKSGEIRGQVSMIEANDNKNYGAKLSGSNEVPAAMSNGTGVAKFNFSNDGNSASFHVNVAGLTNVRFAHIHFAKAGSNGGVVFTLRMDKVNGPVSGLYAQGEIMPVKFSGQLLGGDLFILREAFRTGNAYVNVHTDKFPGGELRGQVN